MRHLFIINPVAYKVKGELDEIIGEVKRFFRSRTNAEYDIHVTRWERDAKGYVRRYANKTEGPFRVHSIGGSGTLFEVVNGIAGRLDVDLAVYPMGRDDSFLRYFGGDIDLFSSLHRQVTSGTEPFDIFRCGNNYGMLCGLVGMEAIVSRNGELLNRRRRLPADFGYILAAIRYVFKKGNLSQKYAIALDGERLDGDYVSILIANAPCYAIDMAPAVEAHPNDGKLHIYLMRNMSRVKLLSTMKPYLSGGYKKFPGLISYHTGSKIQISSESTMCINVDGETFYEDSVSYEVIPGAVRLVCPEGIDLGKIPKIFGRPDTEGVL